MLNRTERSILLDNALAWAMLHAPEVSKRTLRAKLAKMGLSREEIRDTETELRVL